MFNYFLSGKDEGYASKRFDDKLGFGCAPGGSYRKCGKNHVLGVITDRDILIRGHAASAAFSDLSVQDLMSQQVFCADAKDDVHDAAMLMTQRGVRRLPVVENEKLVGILSLKDLAKKRIFIAEIGHIIFEVSNRK